MGELEEKLNSILSSPQEMEKIMGLARSLSGELGGEAPEQSPQQHNNTTNPADMSTLLGGIDPKMLGTISKLMGEYSRPDYGKAAILNSIKPLLKKERQEKLERGLELARMSKLTRLAMSELGGDKDV